MVGWSRLNLLPEEGEGREQISAADNHEDLHASSREQLSHFQMTAAVIISSAGTNGSSTARPNAYNVFVFFYLRSSRRETGVRQRFRSSRIKYVIERKMITVSDFYHVMAAVVPLYVAMFLAYGSVKWWKIFSPDQCSGINRFVALFAVPLLSFRFIASNDPYAMNARFLLADTLQKIIVLSLLFLWCRVSERATLEWAVTLFSVSTLPNTLVMGIPLLKGMYGEFSGSLMVQIVVLQCIIWYTLLLFLFEYRAARLLLAEQFPENAGNIVSFTVDADVASLSGCRDELTADAKIGEDGKLHVTVRKSASSRSDILSRQSGPPDRAANFTPRPSNLTNVEIFSLQSSRNPTPRDSDFNRGDFYGNSSGLLVAEDGGSHCCKVNDAGGFPGRKDLHLFAWSSGSSPVSGGRGELVGNEEMRRGVDEHHIQFHHPHHQPNHHPHPCNYKESSHGINVGEKDQMFCPVNTTGLHPKSGGALDGAKPTSMPAATVMTQLILIMVWRKLIRNPNTYSSLIGLTWSLISFRWGVQMPAIIARSISLLSDAGLGMAMFSLGLFMALQPRMIACGNTIATFSMAVRFFFGPALMAAASIAVGLRGVLLRVAIVQAALPQGIVPFVFAKEYNVHPDILSTGVIFGMLIALPFTLCYYILLGL